MKKYGLVVGRFQTFHNGHMRLIKRAAADCEQVVVLIGSSVTDEKDERHPFSYELRKEMIKDCCQSEQLSVKIGKLVDLTNEDDHCFEWGDHVINVFREVVGDSEAIPDVMVCGADERRDEWFRPEILGHLSLSFVERDELSATLLRYLMLSDSKREWQQHVPRSIRPFYELLKYKLLLVRVKGLIIKEERYDM